MPARGRVQISQIGRVRAGDHQQMAGGQRPDVKKRERGLVGVHHAGRTAPRDDVAEHASCRAGVCRHAGIVPDFGPPEHSRLTRGDMAWVQDARANTGAVIDAV